MKKFIIIITLPLISSCIFYSMAGSIPPHIKSISIPMVENQTVEFGISEAVTDNLVNQLSNARGRTNRSLVLETLENRETVKQIALYMPATVDVNYTVAYGDNEIGGLAMAGQNIIEGLMGPGATIDKLKAFQLRTIVLAEMTPTSSIFYSVPTWSWRHTYFL